MYHSICDEPETGHPYYWINTSPARFAEHMKYLNDNNYQVISLSETVALISGQSGSLLSPPASKRYVVLTFDDGYRDFYVHAFPILKRYGFTAEVFLPTAYTDGKRPGLRAKNHLSWDEVKELQTEGIVFGSHSVDHRLLDILTSKEIEFEITVSKETIENKTGRVVDAFSYPYRFAEHKPSFVNRLQHILEKAGYKHCVTTKIGLTTLPTGFFLTRLPISTGDDIRLFTAKLDGYYDWARLPQRFLKYSRKTEVRD